jgi:POLQ-like helicase
LLTSLRSLISEGSQTVLISAVISNASDIGKWLSGEGSEVISGTSLTPTFRSLAFASWLDRLGRLEFVAPENIDNQEFFVPRIIEQYDLELKGKERKKRIFPSKDDGQAIALFLGLKLAGNGSVAIFCGRKSTAANLSEKVVDIFDRNVILPKPVSFSDQTEVSRLHYLYDCNLGKKASSTQSAALGIFTHHGNTPHGIRIAVEHSMKEGLAKFVICTSTLAQGVNLPIRYLIVTSVYQGLDRIKIRDFHNLIGRAGRAGMHTEGSIIFADPVVFDKRMAHNDKWRWSQVKELMEPSNSEPCVSTLLSLFEPLHSDDRKYTIKMDPLDFVRVYIENEGGLESISEEIVAAHSDKGFTKNGTDRQIEWRMNIIHSIESYLMAQWDESDTGLQEEDIVELAKGTLAFFLSDENNRDQIIELFKHIAKNIDQRVSEPSRRKIFGKTLYGVSTSIDIENWVKENIENIVSCSDGESLLSILWPIVAKNIRNNTFRKCDKPETLKEIALEWIQGKPFFELFEILSGADARLIAATQRRKFQIEHIVDICENAFAYDGTLVIGAVTETIELNEREEQTEIINILQELQKRLKYGLPASGAIPLYELGFSDRLVSMDLESIIQNSPPSKSDVQNQLKQKQDEAFNLLKKYPVYFTERLKNLL